MGEMSEEDLRAYEEAVRENARLRQALGLE